MSQVITHCLFCNSPEAFSGTQHCNPCHEVATRLQFVMDLTKTAYGKKFVIDFCLDTLKTLGIVQRIASHLSQNADLGVMIERALFYYRRLSPEDKARHDRDQAISFAYGNLKLSGRTITYEKVAEAYDKLNKEYPE